MEKRRLSPYNWSKLELINELSKISKWFVFRWCRHWSAAKKNIYGDITSKILIGNCSICNRKKSMAISVQPERLGSFFKNLGKTSAKTGKILATNLLKNPGRALDITANTAAAAAGRYPKALLATLAELIIFLPYW